MSPEQQAVLPLQSATQSVVRESWSYRAKCLLLGPPLVNEQLHEERLSKPLALGVLSSDCISSSAYGSEEMLIVLLPIFGIAAFTILMPLTGVILGVLLLVTLSYREVVMVYTKAGGSYVVARDNFGPTVAQIAAVALMLDYIVTVAVQSAAGTAALASAVPALAPLDRRDHRGRAWCSSSTATCAGSGRPAVPSRFPTYFFIGSMAVVIVVGLTRELFGDLPRYPTNEPGMWHVGTGTAIASSLAVFYLLRAFANGGSSLTGLEAISNGVGAFRSPEGPNARRTLVVMSTILGSLVLGVSWLAHYTHAMPYTQRDADRHLPGGARRPRRRTARSRAVLRRPARHHADPVHRREHLVQRVPVPHQLRGRGLVPAPPADQARAPAGVLQRDHRAGRDARSRC